MQSSMGFLIFIYDLSDSENSFNNRKAVLLHSKSFLCMIINFCYSLSVKCDHVIDFKSYQMVCVLL